MELVVVYTIPGRLPRRGILSGITGTGGITVTGVSFVMCLLDIENEPIRHICNNPFVNIVNIFSGTLSERSDQIKKNG
jgi:hypothetical protein